LLFTQDDNMITKSVRSRRNGARPTVRHDNRHYLLRGLNLAGQGEGPTLLERNEQTLIPVLLDELARPNGFEVIEKSVAASQEGGFKDVATLKLFQPVHRTFYLALLEALCDEFGDPRLAATQIESAGLVTRRLRQDSQGRLLRNESGELLEEGWMYDQGAPVGWLPLDETQRDQDPDPAKRRLPVVAGDPEIDRQLAALTGDVNTLSESVTPLFVAPPELCATRKKTLLYGMTPVTSSEFSLAPTSFDEAQLAELISGLGNLLDPILTPNRLLIFSLAGQSLALPGQGANASNLLRLLRLLTDLDAFGGGPASQTFLATLNQIELTTVSDNGTGKLKAGDFLKKSSERYNAQQEQLAIQSAASLSGQPNQVLLAQVADVVTAGLHWRIDENQHTQITTALKGLIQARNAAVFNGERRFETPGRRYQLRAFMRVRQPNGCPPVLVWSIARSQPFTIAPWYESNGQTPPVQVALPDIFDPAQRDALKKLKPNVAFRVPEKLFNFLQSNDLTKLFDGEKPGGAAGLALDWICGFNIPFITLCAFIVLNIFLSLLNIVFQWLLFIKICIPIPKPK
jgi:hypothetical protein